MKLFALPRALGMMLQLDWCNSAYYKTLAQRTAAAGGRQGAGAAGEPRGTTLARLCGEDYRLTRREECQAK